MFVGVLAIQGAFIEHIEKLNHLISTIDKFKQIKVIEVRNVDDLEKVDGLIIPGGESTTMSLVLERSGMIEALKKFIQTKNIVWGTCAGLILLSNNLVGNTKFVNNVGGLDVTVERNHYGRQTESFEGPIFLKKALLGDEIKPQVSLFIRAPAILEIKDTVTILATRQYNGKEEIIAVEQGNILGTTFHPELTSHLDWHNYFLELVNKKVR